MTVTPSVLVVEDHEAIANALALLLRCAGFTVAGTAHNPARARTLLARRRPAVAVIDADLAGASGLDLISDAHAIGTRVLVYSDIADATILRQAEGAGAEGVISKASSAAELLSAVAAVAAGEPVNDPRFLKDTTPCRIAAPALTRREQEIVTLLARGLTGKQIAKRLLLSPDTVSTHVRNAMRRMGARTRAHLVALTVERQERRVPWTG